MNNERSVIVSIKASVSFSQPGQEFEATREMSLHTFDETAEGNIRLLCERIVDEARRIQSAADGKPLPEKTAKNRKSGLPRKLRRKVEAIAKRK